MRPYDQIPSASCIFVRSIIKSCFLRANARPRLTKRQKPTICAHAIRPRPLFGGSTKVTGRVSGRHACLQKTHDDKLNLAESDCRRQDCR
jgi:hypothetical protein